MNNRLAWSAGLAVGLAVGCGGKLAPTGPECADEVLASTTDDVGEVAADEKGVVWGTSAGDVFERRGTTTTLRANVGGYVVSVALWGDAVLVSTGDHILSLARGSDSLPVVIASGSSIRAVKANAHGVFYIDGSYETPTERLFHVTASGPVLLLETNEHPAYALDGDDLYFGGLTTKADGKDRRSALVRLHLTDFTMETLTTGRTTHSIAVDRDWVYAGTCDMGYGPIPRCPIVRISKASGDVSTLSVSEYDAEALAVQGAALYALTFRDRYESVLVRMGTDGSSPTVLASAGGAGYGFGYFSSLQTTAHTVVWTTSKDSPNGVPNPNELPAVRRMCR